MESVICHLCQKSGGFLDKKWPREIKWKLKTEQLGATTSDVGVTGEIEEYLHK